MTSCDSSEYSHVYDSNDVWRNFIYWALLALAMAITFVNIHIFQMALRTRNYEVGGRKSIFFGILQVAIGITLLLLLPRCQVAFYPYVCVIIGAIFIGRGNKLVQVGRLQRGLLAARNAGILDLETGLPRDTMRTLNGMGGAAVVHAHAVAPVSENVAVPCEAATVVQGVVLAETDYGDVDSATQPLVVAACVAEPVASRRMPAVGEQC